ncbi:MAG: hypothetical protein DRP08_06885, partial [Candidatus Aenigmatarchaeota archaeon]
LYPVDTLRTGANIEVTARLVEITTSFFSELVGGADDPTLVPYVPKVDSGVAEESGGSAFLGISETPVQGSVNVVLARTGVVLEETNENPPSQPGYFFVDPSGKKIVLHQDHVGDELVVSYETEGTAGVNAVTFDAAELAQPGFGELKVWLWVHSAELDQVGDRKVTLIVPRAKVIGLPTISGAPAVLEVRFRGHAAYDGGGAFRYVFNWV